jgi:hypothetical protein
MPISEVILIFIYMLPVLFFLDKNKLKIAFIIFVFLMIPILLKIYISGFEFLVLAQFVCWTASFVLVRFLSLLRK